MMDWGEIIKLHRKKTVDYVAREYGVHVFQVAFIGEVNRPPLPYMCRNHHHDPEPFEDVDGPSLMVASPPTINFKREFEHLDNILNRKTTVFCGQCPDCGQVYVAEHTFGRIS